MSNPQTLPQCVAQFKSRNKNLVAVQYYEKGQLTNMSWQKYFDTIVTLAKNFSDMGVVPKSKVAIMSSTRWEWAALDHALLCLGAWVVPIYQTVTADELEHIINNSQAEILIVENQTLLRVFHSVAKRCESIRKIICIEPLEHSTDSAISWQQLMNTKDSKKFESKFEAMCQKIAPTDTATLIYTSGTTGAPRGVVITHANIFTEVSEAFPLCGARPSDTSLTFLPYAHVLGRIEHWGHAYIGFTLAFAESIERVKANLLEVRPTFLMSVPRIFEKIYAAVQAQFQSHKVTQKISDWALSVGVKVGEYKLLKAPLPLALALEYEVARRSVLNKVSAIFGGRLRFAISGGAPLNREVSLLFHACNILILEGYGLTETTGATFVNTPYDYQFGNVGKPIGETQVKIADDGEILLRSKKTMKEYYLDPAATQAAFTDGWFHTGDIGEIQKNGSLKITDRKKDLIKTAGGKYVAPQRLEGLLKKNPFISNVLIHGDQRKYIVALVALDKTQILNWAQKNQIEYSDYESLTQSAKVLDLIRKAVAETNSELASYESIKRFSILKSDFTIEAGELTPSLKVKRKILDKKFQSLIESLYS